MNFLCSNFPSTSYSLSVLQLSFYVNPLPLASLIRDLRLQIFNLWLLNIRPTQWGTSLPTIITDVENLWLDQHQITHNTKPASLISTGHEDLEKKLVLMQIWFRKTWLQKCSKTSIKQWQLCNKLEESIQRASTNHISRNKVIDRQIHYLLVTRLSFYISEKKITYRLVILGQ